MAAMARFILAVLRESVSITAEIAIEDKDQVVFAMIADMIVLIRQEGY